MSLSARDREEIRLYGQILPPVVPTAEDALQMYGRLIPLRLRQRCTSRREALALVVCAMAERGTVGRGTEILRAAEREVL